MKKLLIGLLLIVPLLSGCRPKEKPVVVEEELVPTGREREILSAYNLSEKSELGQKKLRKLRERTEKLEAAKERMDTWAKEKEEREAQEAAVAEER